MRYLLDTHTFIWFIEGSALLPKKIKKEITLLDNICYISIASIWEIAIKYNVGKLELSESFHKITGFLAENSIQILPIEFPHLQTLLGLELIHRDPFDRVMIAQAISENLVIFTTDRHFPAYPVNCMW